MEISQKTDYVKLQGQDPDEIWTSEYVERLFQQKKEPLTKRKKRWFKKENLKIERKPTWTSLCDCETILDVGCGPGIVAMRLAKRGYNVTGIDKEPKFIEYAKELCKKEGVDCEFLVKNIMGELKLEKKFNCIVCTEVIEHLKTPEKVIEKMGELLKKNGLLVLSTPNYNSLWPVIEMISKSVLRTVNWVHYHITKLTPKSILGLVKKYELKDVKIHTIFLFSPFLPLWLAYKTYCIERKFLDNVYER